MTTAMPLILSFSAMVFWSFGDFLIRRTSKKIGNVETLIFINFVSSLILAPFAVKELSQLNLQNFTPLLILSFFEFAFGLTLLKAYENCLNLPHKFMKLI